MYACNHSSVRCVNQYELIRKYCCEACGGIMMCACEEDFGGRYLPHQLRQAAVPGTHERVPVTLGFVSRVCNTCRGLPEPASPKSDRRGKKIERYYWREISFAMIPRLAEWAQENGYTKWLEVSAQRKDIYRSFHQEAVEEMKRLHSRAPKYVYQDESDASLLTKHSVEVVHLRPSGTRGSNGWIFKVGDKWVDSANEVASLHFAQQGYKAFPTESRPFHVLFGTLVWPVVQDPTDPKVRKVGIGRKLPSGEWKNLGLMWTPLPSDFGSRSYAERRAVALSAHFATLEQSKSDLPGLFNRWLEPSSDLRCYISAHLSGDMSKARELLTILSSDATLRILKYLTDDHWRRHCGWPDFLFHREADFFFGEVKFSDHGLTEYQKQ